MTTASVSYNLKPNLAVLEESLYGPSEELLFNIAYRPETVPADIRAEILAEEKYREVVEAIRSPQEYEEADDDADEETPVMPDSLKRLIDRRLAVGKAKFDTAPCRGQIRMISDAIGPAGSLGVDMRHPLAVLLDAPEPSGDIWRGWMVSPETDYATYWDVVLDPEKDAPLDPLAGMVQLLQPIYCYIPSAPRVIGKLSEETMDGIAAVVRELLFSQEQPEVAPHPGMHIVRTVKGHTVVTGTPLSPEATDPRHRYRELYAGMVPILMGPVELALGHP